jgi:hypothetical protein
MPLQKVTLRPGINRENTRYTTEGGYYESDKVRFRQGTPEKIGGWTRISANTFIGVCRSLWNWVTLGAQNLIGVGTNVKFYIENGGAYYDVTPIRATSTLTNPFTTVNLSTTVTVADAASGYGLGDYVTFYGGTAVGGLTILGEYEITSTGTNNYTITAASAATSSTTGGGTVYAVYQINIGPPYEVPLTGWGSGTWSSGVWGTSANSTQPMRLWNQNNFGQDLLCGPSTGPLYLWSANKGYVSTGITLTIATPCVGTSTINLPDKTAITLETTGALPTGLVVGTIYYTRYVSSTTFNLSATPTGALINTSGSQSGDHTISPRMIALTELNGASSVPLTQKYFIISDASRFTICFGTNDFGSTEFDPMLIRWSDQESYLEWAPAITNQAGSIRLSHGSKIVTAIQSRQEIVVWSDSAIYSLQYLGPPYVWGTQLLADNVSIAGPNAAAIGSGAVFWMGIDKFYKYDGRVQTMRCDLRQYIYSDINLQQADQIFANTNEGFNEIWFFYCSSNSTTVDRYVIYNYLEDIWMYGNMARTAWLDSGLRTFPMAATYSYNIVNHESGVDDNTGDTPIAIESSITSAQFDIGDGHNMAFAWRMLPDLTFRGSTDGTTPSLIMQLLPLQNSGSGYNNPLSVGGTSATASQAVTATQTYPIELDTFTGQVNIRVRGRQMSMKVSCNTLGTQWQLGSPRVDIRPDGRR